LISYKYIISLRKAHESVEFKTNSLTYTVKKITIILHSIMHKVKRFPTGFT